MFLLLRVAAPLASLFFYSTVAVAPISGPDCTSTAWKWTVNSVELSPCTVTAFMVATCSGEDYTFYLLPQGYSYSGPDGFDASNLCYCNTVAYSLFSACGACQGQEWITCGHYLVAMARVTNCTKTLPPSSFPNPVPSGIWVPRWALLDVTIENDWNANESYAVGDSPEAGPGSILGPSGVSSTPTPSSSANSSGGSSSTGGNIAGGVTGAIVVLIITPAAITLYLRRRLRPRSAVTVPADVSASQPQLPQSDEVVPSLSGSPVTMRRYVPLSSYFCTPRTPTTFPEYLGDPSSQGEVTMQSNIGTGIILANTQSRPRCLRQAWSGDITASPLSDLALRSHHRSRDE
ncbi:hypothetical protein DFH94DRAFT_848610 [Russula ochroleuca]|uniref:Uncharacterized protein n=1 Tax=Russula ochroleuca TaxID=152965 RepID=A0A9P5JW20_9AGAM|nr:hypothetical protein DFH94DRAFT_848610 [Russula ochroleuca]